MVLAIYSTLGLARTLAEALDDRGLLGVWVFVFCCVLVLATVVTQGLKTRPSRREVFVATGVAAVYLLVLVRMAIPTERSHLVEYGVVAIFVYEALLERRRHGRPVPVPPVLAVLATSIVGAVDEGLQAALPNRVFDPVDILFNVLAAVMAISASVALRWARRKVQPIE